MKGTEKHREGRGTNEKMEEAGERLRGTGRDGGCLRGSEEA